MRVIQLSILFIFILSFQTQAQTRDLDKLARWMSGSFSNYEQHLKDSANYYHIKLEIIPIWKNRTDGHWFYVEQAVAGYESKPYRQRVYQLTENMNGLYESIIYTFDNPLDYAQQPKKFEKEMSPEKCEEKVGCSVFMEYDHQVFFGSTNIGTCVSERNGSSYATAEVEIYYNKLISWDRGFDDHDKQAWGAELGGYIFLKN